MRLACVLLLLAFSMICSRQARAQAGPGCGQVDVQFNVKTKSGPQPAPALQPGKALVYFLQDDLKFSGERPTTRFGVDGAWVGATHANSYFYVFLDPGEHHICASWQGDMTDDSYTRRTAVTHFTAEAGTSYYFRARDIFTSRVVHGNDLYEVRLAPLDSDEAQVLMGLFSFSSSQPQK